MEKLICECGYITENDAEFQEDFECAICGKIMSISKEKDSYIPHC